MSTHRIAPLLAVAVALTIGCQRNAEQQPELGTPRTFSPTADSSVTARQVAAWLEANKGLDSLAFAYRDSFSTEDAEKRRLYQEQFMDAQDTLCRSVGLVGGYDEYTWITEALAKPVNQALRDSFEVSAHL